ncbi:hypothetical protein Bca52824_062456 [Brassica carinata]|uniref:Syntaxin N-terminal domain-containing protein n=1 Tax=Brassica carinata TaxID=52824 RepID=A0A8X7U874_BRACI|nr:hypothetical protein Bca52824_062456 [Brassica carinata]
MNDLFSNSFKRNQALMSDVEAGQETMNLDKFFEDVENVKDDMKGVETLYKKLQDSNEECQTVHNAKKVKELRAKMDADVGQVLKRVKIIKQKTRSSVVSGLGKKLKDLMDSFQSLRARMNDEYKETVERRYFTITGEKADEQTIDNLIASEQGRGQIMDTISEIQERHDAVKEIEKNLLELHQQLNNIESHVAKASSFVRRGTDQLQDAREYQKSSRKWTCYAIILFIVVFILLLIPAMPHIMLMLK